MLIRINVLLHINVKNWHVTIAVYSSTLCNLQVYKQNPSHLQYCVYIFVPVWMMLMLSTYHIMIFFTFSPEKSIALGKHFFRVKVISCLMWLFASRWPTALLFIVLGFFWSYSTFKINCIYLLVSLSFIKIKEFSLVNYINSAGSDY